MISCFTVNSRFAARNQRSLGYAEIAVSRSQHQKDYLIMKQWMFSLLVLMLAFGNAAQADELNAEELRVLEAVNQLLHSINTNDLELMANVTREDGMNFILFEAEDGTHTVRGVPQSNFLDSNNQTTEELHERIWNPQVIVSGPLAVVVADYDFYRDGQFSHCGVDVFNLIYDVDVWKVANMSWTAKREGCEPSPLGPFSQ